MDKVLATFGLIEAGVCIFYDSSALRFFTLCNPTYVHLIMNVMLFFFVLIGLNDEETHRFLMTQNWHLGWLTIIIFWFLFIIDGIGPYPLSSIDICENGGVHIFVVALFIRFPRNQKEIDMAWEMGVLLSYVFLLALPLVYLGYIMHPDYIEVFCFTLIIIGAFIFSNFGSYFILKRLNKRKTD